MKNQTVQKSMEKQSLERVLLQRALIAANNMMYQLQIPEGTHLIFALNQPEARDNKDAICHWLLGQSGSQPIDNGSYGELKSKLNNALLDYG